MNSGISSGLCNKFATHSSPSVHPPSRSSSYIHDPSSMLPILGMVAGDGNLMQWICPSCGFIFDESLGFKKKYPPGTKFEVNDVSTYLQIEMFRAYPSFNHTSFL
jgi:hypothetical protein